MCTAFSSILYYRLLQLEASFYDLIRQGTADFLKEAASAEFDSETEFNVATSETYDSANSLRTPEPRKI